MQADPVLIGEVVSRGDSQLNLAALRQIRGLVEDQPAVSDEGANSEHHRVATIARRPGSAPRTGRSEHTRVRAPGVAVAVSAVVKAGDPPVSWTFRVA